MTDVLNLTAWKNNSFMKIKDIDLTILDFGFIHCDATYDVMKTKNNEILFFDYHYNRYVESCKYFNFNPITNIQEIVKELIKKNNVEDVFVWVLNWRGIPPSGSPRDLNGPEHQCVYVKPYYTIKKSDDMILGIHKENRRSSDDIIPQKYKNFSWIELTKAQKFANENNYDSAILLDTKGYITEGPGFGICFIDKNNTVITPKHNCLQSVTINVVEDVCKKIGFKFERRNITVAEAFSTKEAFICSTSGGITPIKTLGHMPYKSNKTKSLMEHFDKEI